MKQLIAFLILPVLVFTEAILCLPSGVVQAAESPTPTTVPRPQQERLWTKGLITLKDGVPRHVEYLAPLQGQPTLVFTNGLVYNISRWQEVRENLAAKGYGLLFYYFRGQHETLRAEADKFKEPLFFKDGLDTADFSAELLQVLDQLGIQERVHLIGLSYGAHIVASFASEHSDRVDKVIFLAPLVRSLDQYDPSGAWLLQNLDWLKLTWGPLFGPYFYEMAYRQIYQSYLNQRVVPDRVPEELRDRPEIYRESLFHLVRAVRNFDLRRLDFHGLQNNSVSVILAKEDSEKVFADQKQVAAKLASGRLQQLIFMPEASHAIPDSEGNAAAEIIHLLIQNDPRLTPGGASILKGQELSPWRP